MGKADVAFQLLKDVMALRVIAFRDCPGNVELHEVLDKVYDGVAEVAEAAVAHDDELPAKNDKGEFIDYKMKPKMRTKRTP